MKIAVLTRPEIPFSLETYRESIRKELSILGVEIIPFTKSGPDPENCDIIWEPGLAGNHTPPDLYKNFRTTIVATVHGAALFTLKRNEMDLSFLQAIRCKFKNRKTLSAWKWFKGKISAVITVSEFAAREVSHVFALPRGKIHPIYHGVDHETFHQDGDIAKVSEPYFLHVSQYSPKKNVDRIIHAYENLSNNRKPELIMIAPGYTKTIRVNGIRHIREKYSPYELAKWYRGSIGFVFPSLHETFGMPVLEALACGCPVITSNATACAEIANDAALLVNPRSEHDITCAMQRLGEDASLRDALRKKGLARAQNFSWQKSAREHLDVFEKVLKSR
ncbi:glycosyltransferase family 1 protein [Candidatus Kuenenia sp.]|uniref:glycosyltransferase family 4 protein n=1 Tax=Candidatus Kuenenia sp. TaxID=2499824 RepID=UPI00322048D0